MSDGWKWTQGAVEYEAEITRLKERIKELERERPQVFGEISEGELAEVEKAVGGLPKATYRVESTPGRGSTTIRLGEDFIFLDFAISDYSHESDRIHANAIVCILNTLPKLLATIRTQASLIGDLMADLGISTPEERSTVKQLRVCVGVLEQIAHSREREHTPDYDQGAELRHAQWLAESTLEQIQE